MRSQLLTAQPSADLPGPPNRPHLPDDLPVDSDVVLALVLVEEPLIPPEELLLPLERLAQHDKPLSGNAEGKRVWIYVWAVVQANVLTNDA